MKRILLPLLLIAFLASCTKNVSSRENSIILSAGVPTTSISIDTKAPVDGGNTFTAAVAGWEAAAGAQDYTAATTWKTTSSINASATALNITLAAPQIYNSDVATKTYMKAWYPEGTLTAGVVSFVNSDGSVDAMIAPEVIGARGDRDGKNLAFAHKTTQLKFVAKIGAGIAAGTTVNSITIKNVQIPTGFTLSDGNASFSTPAADLPVAGVAAPIVLTTEGVAVGNPVMIKPITGSTITLDVVSSIGTHQDIVATIDDDLNFQEGKAYTITISFTQRSIVLSSSVAEWTLGTGSANIDI